METITTTKSELKSLIRESLEEFFPKVDYVTDIEQKKLEKDFGKSPTFENEEERILL